MTLRYDLLSKEAEANHIIYKNFPIRKEGRKTINKDGLVLKYIQVFLDNKWQDILWHVSKSKTATDISHNIYLTNSKGRTLELKEWAILYDLRLLYFRRLIFSGVSLEEAIQKCPKGFLSSELKNPFRPQFTEVKK